MERFDSSNLDEIAFRAINQKGDGSEIDRYIYSQNGEGLASFFGSLAKKAIPFLGKAIKGAAKAAAPHVQDAAIAAGTNLLQTAVDKIPKKRSKRELKEVVDIKHTPHKRRVNGL